MKNLMHIDYGRLKDDIQKEVIKENYRVIRSDEGKFNEFLLKEIYSDTNGRFVSIYLYSYNDIMIDDHSSYETDLWNIRQCTPFDLVTFAPELINYLIDDVSQVTSLEVN